MSHLLIPRAFLRSLLQPITPITSRPLSSLTSRPITSRPLSSLTSRPVPSLTFRPITPTTSRLFSSLTSRPDSNPCSPNLGPYQTLTSRPVSFQAARFASAGYVMTSQLEGKNKVEFFSDPTLDYDADKILHGFLSDFWNITPAVARAAMDHKPGEPVDPMLLAINTNESKEPQKTNLTLHDVVRRLEAMAPLSLAEPWDNVGLLIEPHNTTKHIKNIMLTIDLTDEVLKEAVENGTDLIIAYHPPIFAPLKRVTNDKWKERVVSTCLAHNIAVYSPHTTWDAIQGGINDWLASIYNISEYYPLVPSKPEKFNSMIAISHKINETDVVQHLTHIAEVAFGPHQAKESVTIHTVANTSTHILIKDSDLGTYLIHTVANTSTHVLIKDSDLGTYLSVLYSNPRKYDSVTVAKCPVSPSRSTGSGRMVELVKPIPLLYAIKKMKAHLKKLVLRVALPQGKHENEIMINSIAVCAGSGGELLRGKKADLYITGEMSHHDVLDATHRGTTVLLLEREMSHHDVLDATHRGTTVLLLEHSDSELHIHHVLHVYHILILGFVTGEMSHHDVLDATHRGTSVLLLEHSDSERPFLQTMHTLLQIRLWHYLDWLKIYVSKADKDPIGYV
ncbi:hypothetical protein M8J75_007988 [Diaphorina citri]|nr:hypothetical protein M8J75_007988 [Diaphorina citri]